MGRQKMSIVGPQSVKEMFAEAQDAALTGPMQRKK
jgi:hypothetical protein